LARAAQHRFAAQARRTVLAGLLVRGIGEITTLAWTQTQLVLHIAAAYGHDPTAPDRAADLLTLLRIHPNLEAARAALTKAQADAPTPGPPGAAWRLAQLLGDRSGRRTASRLIPGAGLLLGAALNGAATESLARRATTHYQPTRH
jgi:hypothetical protein